MEFPRKIKFLNGKDLETNDFYMFERGDGERLICDCKKDFRDFKSGERYEVKKISDHKMWREAIRNWFMIRNPHAYTSNQLYRYVEPKLFYEYFEIIEKDENK